MLPFLLFGPLWFILVKLWLFSFPGTNLTWLANSCCHSQHATKPLCGQSRSCIYEFLAENCEFSVTILFLILFSILLDKFVYSFPDVSQTTSGNLPALSPIFMASIMVSSNPLLDAMNVSSQGHLPPCTCGLCSDNTLMDSVPGPVFGTRDTAGK